jgi:hypothetical protein
MVSAVRRHVLLVRVAHSSLFVTRACPRLTHVCLRSGPGSISRPQV